jgi:hypothetical protein
MQRCPGLLSNRPRGAPPRTTLRSLRSSASASLSWAISSNLARRRFTSIRRRQRQFWVLPRVFLGEPNQSLRLFAWPQTN